MKMVERVCPVCERKAPSTVTLPANFDLTKLDAQGFASRKFPEHMHLQMHTCSTCDVLFANPALDSSDLVSAYTDASFESSQEADDAGFTYESYLRPRLAKLGPLQSALDVGCGNGNFLLRLQQLGYQQVTGVEPSLAPIQVADKAIRPFIKHTAYHNELFRDASFNLVCCFMTLEHVSSPGELMRDFARILQSKGAVYCVTHNYRSFLARLMGTKSPIYDVEHMQLFSPISLKQLLSNAGFQDVEVFSISNKYPLSYWIKLLPLPKPLKILLIKMLIFIKLDSIKIPLNVGNMAVIGRKP